MIWSSIPRRTTVNTSLLHETGWYLLLLQTQFTNVAQDQWQQPRSNKKVKLNYNFILFFKQVCWISLLNCSWLKGNRAIPAISAFKADRKRTYSEKHYDNFQLLHYFPAGHHSGWICMFCFDIWHQMPFLTKPFVHLPYGNSFCNTV